MPASTLKIIALVIIVASLLAAALGVFNYLQDGKLTSTLALSVALLCLGIFYYFTADRFGKKPADLSSTADDEEA